MSSTVLPREEYVEQAYFFHILRERLATNLAAQEVLNQLHEEILATTRLPLAIQFLATEMKHSGLLSSGFARLPHYFTPFQTFVVHQAEQEGLRFNIYSALLILEREAEYRSGQPTPSGLFVFQFEAICRNRLGYDEGMAAVAADPAYDGDWRSYLSWVRTQVGLIDFADLLYFRSQLFVQDQKRQQPGFEPTQPPLLGDKEGKIAKASRKRDPLYLFAALQRQLGYPEVPRPRPPDDLASKFTALQAKLREWETRLKLVESEVRGQVDLSQFGKPDILKERMAEDDE